MNNDHVNLCSEETNAENNAGLVVHLYRIVPHIHSALLSTLYLGKRSAIEIFVESTRFLSSTLRKTDAKVCLITLFN